jgi:hypothetical protein
MKSLYIRIVKIQGRICSERHYLRGPPGQRWSRSGAIHASNGKEFGRAIEITGVTNHESKRHDHSLAYLLVPE